MAALQTTVAAMGLYYPRTGATDANERDVSARRIVAQTATMLAAIARHRKGLPPVTSRTDLSHAANFLWMLNDEMPAEILAKTLDVALILHAEHTLNASTFTCRVVASTEADPYASTSAALGSLGGPLHGGANEQVLKMLGEIGEPSRAKAWFDNAVAQKKKIMGLGHRVYKVKDPRAYALQKLAQRVFKELGSTKLYDIAQEIERLAAEKLGPRGIYPNVDFFSGTVYLKMGLEPVLFTPIFGSRASPGTWPTIWSRCRTTGSSVRTRSISARTTLRTCRSTSARSRLRGMARGVVPRAIAFSGSRDCAPPRPSS